MEYKGLAIDLDGTLLVGEDLSAENRDAVRAAKQAGFEVIIATARWRHMAQRISAEIGLDGPIIACSGAEVYLPGDGVDIFDHRLPDGFTQELYELCNQNRCIATITTEDEVWLKLDGEPNPALLSAEMRWVPQLDHVAQGQPRIAAIQGTALVNEIKQNLLPKWQDSINLYDSIGPSGKLVITITAKAANKGEALRNACLHTGIDPAHFISFGDAENDIEMFKITGASVAMGQAEDFIKQAATHTTLNNTEHGVAAAIHKLLDTGRL
ncbi:MAG: Cof-type HAD-IIB family hydrolase [Pseudomonadales bacterium]